MKSKLLLPDKAHIRCRECSPHLCTCCWRAPAQAFESVKDAEIVGKFVWGARRAKMTRPPAGRGVGRWIRWGLAWRRWWWPWPRPRPPWWGGWSPALSPSRCHPEQQRSWYDLLCHGVFTYLPLSGFLLCCFLILHIFHGLGILGILILHQIMDESLKLTFCAGVF